MSKPLFSLLVLCFLSLIGLTACGGGNGATAVDPAATRVAEGDTTIALPLVTTPANTDGLVAFPGAEGFGAVATGGRGGQVIYVTNLNTEGPGSFQEALNTPGPRTILFKVSGVINAPANITYGDVTIAGQTSPGGIIVRGLVCDGHYDQNSCSNLIIRHLRSRPAAQVDNNQNVLDDALRLDGLHTFIIDHGSFANATDEAIQISWASQGTIQNTLLAETVGEHFDRGGMLINYSHSDFPQDNLSIHHNMWYRIGGRMPELSCEPSGYPDGPAEDPSLCGLQPLHIELANNLLWDPILPIWYNPLVDPGGDPGLGTFHVYLNWVNNYLMTPPDYTQAMLLSSFIQEPGNQLYVAGNQMNLYPTYSDYDLIYCCNDFNLYNPNTEAGVAQRLTQRHPYPAISYTPTDQVVPYVIGNVGAFPRDPMDTRFITAVAHTTFDPTPRDTPGANDALDLAFDPNNPPAAPTDSDNDGMPDAWETTHGLNPNAPDNNGSELSIPLTGVAGYTNLECYLNELADSLVQGQN